MQKAEWVAKRFKALLKVRPFTHSIRRDFFDDTPKQASTQSRKRFLDGAQLSIRTPLCQLQTRVEHSFRKFSIENPYETTTLRNIYCA